MLQLHYTRGANKMAKKALLVIDMQKSLVEDKPFDIDNVVSNIQKLINTCRNNGVEVVYLQHQNPEDEELKKGSDGWQIYNKLKPLCGEKVIDKTYNSGFKNTELKQYLESRGITDLILTGMQTEYCFDVTCKVAFEYGYKLTVPEHCNTTFDDEEDNLTGEQIYNFYMYAIWDEIFADIKTCDEVIKDIEE